MSKERMMARVRIGRFSAVGALLLAVLGGNLVSASPAAANDWFMLKNMNSGLCLHASSGGGPGAWVTQEVCNPGENNQWWTWQLGNSPDTVFQIQALKNFGSDACVDTYNGNNPGTVIMWYCTFTSSQYLAKTHLGGNLENYMGMSVEPPGLSKQPGTQMIMWRTNGTLNQQWTYYN
ncbi:RICIN domain-containing protein [Streptomyces sp. NPDC059247]|uniref:RICIN domain-containing protein n=1 Tax=Streptomyces sp. NPDC059247 TaxID=3346790 RepID=UPI0036C06FEB